MIAVNRKARHDYFIEDHFEAGLELQGWEVKSLRAGKGQINEAYVVLHNGEAWLLNAHFSPQQNVPDYIKAEPTRTRKLLLHKREIGKLLTAKDREGYTIVPLDLHWTRNKVKIEIAIAKGKKQHDKRDTTKAREWQREKQRILKH